MSESARIWGLRLLALAISVAVWYSVSLSDRESLSEITVDQAVVSYSLPRNVVVLEPVRSVRVRLRGTDKQIRQLNPSVVKVQVEIRDAAQKEINVNLGPDNVQAPSEFEVAAIDPNVIRVRLDREVTQRIPVKAQLTGEPAAGARVGSPEVLPNQVMVSGPESLIAKLDSLTTEPVRLDGHALDFEATVAVVPPPDPLVQVVQPSRVLVQVPLTPPQTAGDGGEAKERRKEKS